MRSAGNFSPEWGYLAPAPSFMRTARIVVVATAIGATAGAGVVLSLLDRPAAEGDRTSLAAAHAIVTSVQAATAADRDRADRFGAGDRRRPDEHHYGCNGSAGEGRGAAGSGNRATAGANRAAANSRCQGSRPYFLGEYSRSQYLCDKCWRE